MTVTLRTFEVRGAEPGPTLLITGGVHGDEFESIVAIQELLTLFHRSSPEVDGLRGNLHFVPIVNEAAFLRGHRCAEDGLDLARTCPGRIDGSVTEQTAWALAERIRQADYYIDLHTGGTELAVAPLAGYMMHHDAGVLETQRRMARAFNLPIIWGTAANLDGRSLSVARDANVPAIYCEYLGSATCRTAGVDAYVSGCLNVMSELGMFPRVRPESRVQYVVENPQPNSGHMQVCNPSPINGLFLPSVQLGDLVRAGDELGTVVPLDGTPPVSITADHHGVVIVLRTFPRVQTGMSVGVVMELP